MKIILAAVEAGLFKAWKEFCSDLPCVELFDGSILDARCDAVVSPANSFGFMDGGIDALYSDRFGWHVEKELKRLIHEHHHGELVVGSAEIVETNNAAIPYVVAAPTMRVPMILGPETVHPYLAARAALLLVGRSTFKSGRDAGKNIRDHVETVAFPGLGTGVGRVPFAVCARQVRVAIEEFVTGEFRPPKSWAEASERHQLLYTDRLKRLQWEDK